jgi:excisionase family DNA binding protein
MPQASDHLGGVPSAETLYRLAREGHLPVKVIGRRILISERRLDEWADTPGDARSGSGGREE